MVEKVLTQIREAEAQARALIENAQEEATQIIKRTEEEARGTLSQFSEKSKQRSEEMKQKAELDARKHSEVFAAETEKECAALREELLTQKSGAIDSVLQMIGT